jgi:hypothetical protein
MISDKELLEIYMCGFTDELDGVNSVKQNSDLKQRAYNLDILDAIIGDDVPSNDLQTNEQILKQIKNIINN